MHHQIGRGHPTAARILRRWRALSGGKQTRDHERRTLIACSGGADSVALAVALAQVPESCVIAHVQHDLRPLDETRADLAAAQALAGKLRMRFVHTSVAVSDRPGNTEANARAARYTALQTLAQSNECPYIATGHHADDQLETLLIHLMRGSGTRGMGGMQPKRAIGSHQLLRPMLEVTRAESQTMLTELEISWREDTTNQDKQYLRNRIRHDLLPIMRSIDPDIAVHASSWASDLVAMQNLIDNQLASLLQQHQDRWSWSRATLREQPELLLGYLPGSYCESVLAGKGADGITRRAINAWINAVKSVSTDPNHHRIGPILARVHADLVTFTHAQHESDRPGETP